LFTSQQTWLLFTLQFCFISVQSVFLSALGSDVNNNQAVFMSINTRHAGFSSVDLSTQNAGILVFFLAMMSLAPTPFVVVLQRSGKESSKRTTHLEGFRDSVKLGDLVALTADPGGESSEGGLMSPTSGLISVERSLSLDPGHRGSSGVFGGSEHKGGASDGEEEEADVAEVLHVIAETAGESTVDDDTAATTVVGGSSGGSSGGVESQARRDPSDGTAAGAAAATPGSGRGDLHGRAAAAVERASVWASSSARRAAVATADTATSVKQGIAMTSRASLVRYWAPLTEVEVQNRLASRALAMALAAQQQEQTSAGGTGSDGEDDPFMDTRLVS
jgi:hypothetical protein